jgi:hypothetical protein
MTVPHAGSGAARVIGDGDEAEWGGRGWVAICAIEPVPRRAMIRSAFGTLRSVPYPEMRLGKTDGFYLRSPAAASRNWSI